MKIAWKLIALHVYVFNNLKYVSCWFYYRSSLQKKPKVPFIFISFAVFKILLLRNMYAFFFFFIWLLVRFLCLYEKAKRKCNNFTIFSHASLPPKKPENDEVKTKYFIKT